MKKMQKFNLNDLEFDRQGLIPAIIQDSKTNEVLMLAFMNKTSLRRSLKLGKTCFWSRSRKVYWVKGGTSGNYQFINSIAYDCDMDALLIKVRQVGKGACHTGNRSCFYRKMEPTRTKACGRNTRRPKIAPFRVRMSCERRV